eukprot:365259-Chlamydomonas_euryale.AAC.5
MTDSCPAAVDARGRAPFEPRSTQGAAHRLRSCRWLGRLRRRCRSDCPSCFWMTDACPAAVVASGRAPFAVLPLAGPIAAALHI